MSWYTATATESFSFDQYREGMGKRERWGGVEEFSKVASLDEKWQMSLQMNIILGTSFTVQHYLQIAK